MDSPKVTLLPDELKIIEYIASKRLRENRHNDVVNRRVGQHQNDMQVSYIGTAAEFAAARYLNLCPDWSYHSRSGGYDLLTHNNIRIDVKCTQNQKDDLICYIGKKLGGVDVYMHVRVELPDFFMVGWCFEDELINPDRIVDFGYGATYCVPGADLRRFELPALDLIRMVERSRVWQVIG